MIGTCILIQETSYGRCPIWPSSCRKMRSIASAPSIMTGTYLLPVHRLGDCRAGVPDQACDLLNRHAVIGEQRDEAMPHFPGRPLLCY
jgi:hypothetical protein